MFSRGETRISRRSALTAMAWSALAVSACSAGGPTMPEFWRTLGRSATRQHPELDRSVAESELGTDLDTTLSEDGAGRERVLERIRSDFASGDIIEVDGWWLSRTEVLAAVFVAGADR